MGIVWKGVDTALDREVAIKVLPEAFAADPERLARFEREAKLLASLNHPHVAAVYGLHRDQGLHFLALELVRGRSLREAIAQGIPPASVVPLAIEIADGLAAAHRQQITHRDLKPDNVMLDADGGAKVLDFGLARSGGPASRPDASTLLEAEVDATTTREGTLLGTVAYMSPEQAQGKAVDSRSDIFSFGILLYEMATGRRPFEGDNNLSILTSILRDTPKPIGALSPAIPRDLERIVSRCLEKEPAKRYADARELRDDLRAFAGRLSSPSGLAPDAAPRGRRWIVPATIAALLAISAVAGSWLYQRGARERWVRNQALPELAGIVDRIQMLEEGRESWDAYLLSRRIDAASPGEPLVERLRPKFTRSATIESDPPGAEVRLRYYDDLESEPLLLGTTPLEKFVLPRGFTRVRLTFPGHDPVDDVIWNGPLVGDRWSYRLPKPGEVPPEMVEVPEGTQVLGVPGLDHLQPERTPRFLIDRHEVSNRDYARFVEAGGYREARYWKPRFLDGSRELSFAEAMGRFTDTTGRPGPAGWEVGTFPEGRGEHPVTGVSWYEAAAYAEWAGKSLPTIFHWNLAALPIGSSHIVPMANFGQQDSVPAGSTHSANRFGAEDLAGNAREWIWNASGDSGTGSDPSAHFILGGGWTDPDYAFADAYAQPAFDRSATNGFRCIRLLTDVPNLDALTRAVERPSRDFMSEKPVDDAMFAQYLRQFAYDRTPLDAKIEEDIEVTTGRRQKITFAAAYGGERLMAYLFLPPAGKPPYQVVVTFPGSGAINVRSSANIELTRLDFLAKGGRAVIWPIYKGTYERGGELHSDYPEMTTAYKDHVVMWGKDLSRALDYVETRPDLDAGRIAYYGLSWGGALGATLPAVEPRIKANVLYVAGLSFQRALPEVDPINYITRVKQPTLILNGELDFYFPLETSQRPMFDLLGTPAEHKKRLVFPGGHSVPRTETIRESLAWLDRYLGPVAP